MTNKAAIKHLTLRLKWCQSWGKTREAAALETAIEAISEVTEMEKVLAAANLSSTPHAPKTPAYLIQVHTGKWHAFEDRTEGEQFYAREKLDYRDGGRGPMSVHEWIWHGKGDANV